ncbi:hypothetical protein SAMN05892883_2572 [Jatrophihabitans sp. GAS493]|uniref:hypothetical protein n=1 Tax=Jatrophihabitans sp. GAS493 TaxID=1907575 RepID=UPI000BB95571|nr:hypothetical protein [Jatrophihabitans sp. GAS493]SOD73281.1 hypothetical protein SAMN05892883_2572 [Jatrophihabitans sp. GAS493]
MASYSVESKRQPMVATGIVDVSVEWEDKPGGGRRPSDRQARHEGTGMPLWGVEVLYPQTSFGRTATVTAKVTVGAIEQPKPALYAPISFEGLTVEVRTNKAGGLSETWTAEAIADAKPASKSFTPPASAAA